MANAQRRGLPDVPRVLLERETEDADLLVGDGVEQAGNDLAAEGRFLVLIHVNDLLPILRGLVQALRLADVHQIKDVLLEARAAEPDGRVQKLRADPTVGADGPRHLRHIGTGPLAELGYAIDAADALREHRVRHELRQLRAPQVRRQDPAAGHPSRVDVRQNPSRGHALLRRSAADEDAVGEGEVLHGGAFGEELRIGEDPIRVRPLVRRQHPGQGLRGPHGHGGLLDDDLAAVRALRHRTAHALDVPQVRRPAGADARDLGRRVHRREDDVGLPDGALHVRREEEVLPPARLHDLGKARLVDGQVVRIPRRDPRLVQVHDGDLDVGALQRDRRTRGAADVAGADAANAVHGHAQRRMRRHGFGKARGRRRRFDRQASRCSVHREIH
mmetsp:Transcript_89189/g.273159  ORF Transcript_89189/g.273159 Transcript_89189/m.273159 type:complete len:388 (-) Transcript_89189:11-1174(-)